MSHHWLYIEFIIDIFIDVGIEMGDVLIGRVIGQLVDEKVVFLGGILCFLDLKGTLRGRTALCRVVNFAIDEFVYF